MDETTRRLKIASDLMRLMAEIPKLLSRIGEAGKMATEAQRIDLELMAKRIVERLGKAAEMAEAEEDNAALYEQLIASMDGVREELAQANLILDKLLRQV